MLDKNVIETRLAEAKQRLAKITEALNQARSAVAQLTEQRFITMGQIDSMAMVLEEVQPPPPLEAPKSTEEKKEMNGSAKEEVS